MEASIPVTVAQATPLTSEVTRYDLRSTDGQRLPSFEAGAHILVDIEPGLTRAYSLCGNPADTQHYTIAVKREEAGRGGSLRLTARARQGTRLQISAPRNLFSLAEEAPHHLLIGGGIGLTPLVAMAHALHDRNAPFTLIACCRSAEHLPFADLLENGPWKAHVHLRYDDDTPVSELGTILNELPTGTHAYCCGPEGFMQAMHVACGNIPGMTWHQESFGAEASAPAATSEMPIRLFLARSGVNFEVPAGTTLLDALRERGIQVDSACEQGVCGSCVVRYLEGQPIHGDTCLTDDERKEYVALCSARCASDSLTLDI